MAAPRPDEVHDTVETHSKMFRDLMLGFVRIHILHHANIEPVYGSGISAEMERHGYRLSWGTLYPLLHNLTAEGFLAREDRVVNGKVRKYYTITPLGKRALQEAREKAIELVNEITEDEITVAGTPVGAPPPRRRPAAAPPPAAADPVTGRRGRRPSGAASPRSGRSASR